MKKLAAEAAKKK